MSSPPPGWRNCDRCDVLYDPEHTLSGDYRYVYCSGLCQAQAGVLTERDILAAQRREFTAKDLAALKAKLDAEEAHGPMCEAIGK